MLFFFFFSSRRRHTRCGRDWSSDVCSSDLRSAVRQIEEWPENKRRRHGYALADADWHEGVIGIVASRLVERYHRPVVLIAGGEDAWKGSGRSIGSFDLHEALAACSDHLVRWGGHRAAAGLSINPADVDAFARAF